MKPLPPICPTSPLPATVHPHTLHCPGILHILLPGTHFPRFPELSLILRVFAYATFLRRIDSSINPVVLSLSSTKLGKLLKEYQHVDFIADT